MRVLAKATRWTTAAVAAVALFGPAGGVAAATTPVPGVETTVTVGYRDARPVVSPDGTTAYVSVADADGSLKVKTVDTQSGRITGQIGIGVHNGANSPALSPDGSLLYVLNDVHLFVIDTASSTVLASVTVPEEPLPDDRWVAGRPNELALSPDGSTVYVSKDGAAGFRQRGYGSVLTFDTAQRAFTGSVRIPAMNVNGLAVRADGHGVYVGANVGVVHLDTTGAVPAVVGTVPATATVYGHELALTPDGHRLLAVNASGNGVADLVDTATDTATTHLALTSGFAALHHPRAAADGTRFYVGTNAASANGSVLALDSATGAAVPAESVTGLSGTYVSGLALGPDGHTFYVGGSVGDTVVLQIVTRADVLPTSR